MNATVQIIGAVTAIISAAAIAFAAYSSPNLQAGTAFVAMVYGVLGLLAGSMLLILGRIADDVAALRKMQEKGE